MKRTKINQKEAEIGPIKNRKFFLPLLDSNSFSSPALVLVIAKIEKLGASLHQLKQNKTDFFFKTLADHQTQKKIGFSVAARWQCYGVQAHTILRLLKQTQKGKM